MSDDLVKNLCSREDLNYPDEADVRKALKSSSGRPKDAIKLLRKQADKQPKRAPADSKASAAVGGAAGGAPVPAETVPAETAPAAASGGAPAPGAAAELLPVPAGSPVYSATRDVAVTPSLEIAPGAEQLGKLSAGVEVYLLEKNSTRKGVSRARVVLLSPHDGWSAGQTRDGWVNVALKNGTTVMKTVPGKRKEADEEPPRRGSVDKKAAKAERKAAKAAEKQVAKEQKAAAKAAKKAGKSEPELDEDEAMRMEAAALRASLMADPAGAVAAANARPPCDGVLQVEVVVCSNLLPADKTGKSDPYIRLSMGSTAVQTTPRQSTVNPTFKETLPMPLKTIGHSLLLLEVAAFDRDKTGSNDFLGGVCAMPYRIANAPKS
jgi:hypothetical protein